MKKSGPAYHNDVPSGILPGSFSGMNAEFSSVEELHVSERHVVLKARRYNRLWILKGVNPENDSAANRAALRKEFEIMMMLPSEGFPRAYAFEEVEGYGPCIVMEFIEGETLARWLETKHRRSERRRMALRLMDIVARMHGSGVVSRDIKPSNIIVSKLSGAPVLIDFDLADTNQHTAFKQPGGTSGYISPEQAVSFSPDRRNDIYSLASVILEMEPPMLWKSTLQRCRRNIECRVPDAGRLRDRLVAISRIPGIAAAALCLAAIVGAAVWAGGGKVETVEKTIVLKADNHLVDSLNNELGRMRDSVEARRIAEEKRQRIISNESGKAAGWVKRQWRDLERNPEATSLNLQAELQKMVQITYGMDSIRHNLYKRFDASEYSIIEAEMNKTYNQCYSKWKKKIEMN